MHTFPVRLLYLFTELSMNVFSCTHSLPLVTITAPQPLSPMSHLSHVWLS